MVEERDNYVYIVEADPEAVKRAVRRLQVLVLTLIPVFLIGVVIGVVLRALDGKSPLLAIPLADLLVLLAIPVVLAYFVVPRCIKKMDVMIGGDFVNAPLAASPRYATTVRYKDISRVRINLSEGRIVGAVITARGVAVCTGRIKNPGIVVRTILERAPDDVKWRRSGWPSKRLSREEVKELLDKARVRNINDLLPPSKEYARADQLFSRDQPRESLAGVKGRLKRFWDGVTYRDMTIIRPEIPTPASRYVNFILLQMLRDGETTRILKQTQPLPTLTIESGTAEPPPFQEVLNRLKTMCRLDQTSDRGPADGTVHVTINKTPCKVVCSFGDDAGMCCRLRLERIAE